MKTLLVIAMIIFCGCNGKDCAKTETLPKETAEMVFNSTTQTIWYYDSKDAKWKETSDSMWRSVIDSVKELRVVVLTP